MHDTQVASMDSDLKEAEKKSTELGPSIPMEPGSTIPVDMAKVELRAIASLFTHAELAILFIDAQTRYRDAKFLLNKIKRMQHLKADNA